MTNSVDMSLAKQEKQVVSKQSVTDHVEVLRDKRAEGACIDVFLDPINQRRNRIYRVNASPDGGEK